VVANSALTAYKVRNGGFKPVLHGVIPTVSSLIGLVVIYYSVYPVPSGAIGKAVLVSIAWLVVGFGVMVYYIWRHPDLLRLAGRSRDREEPAPSEAA
jgi:hypothetical protein